MRNYCLKLVGQLASYIDRWRLGRDMRGSAKDREYNTPSKGPRLVATSPSVLRAAGIARRYRRLRTRPSPLNDAVRQSLLAKLGRLEDDSGRLSCPHCTGSSAAYLANIRCC